MHYIHQIRCFITLLYKLREKNLTIKKIFTIKSTVCLCEDFKTLKKLAYLFFFFNKGLGNF